MGLQALTHRDDGTLMKPTSEADWDQWIAATDIRNYLIRDPLLDWLDRFGEQAGFLRDTALPTYDKRTNLTLFIFGQSAAFQDAVVNHLGSLISVERMDARPDQTRQLATAEATFEAMQRGAPIVHRGVIWNAESQTYGIPDLLVRSDMFDKLFPGVMTEGEASIPGGDLESASWHYVVVDIKFQRLSLNAKGGLLNSGSARAGKGQVFLYNQALGRLQGYLPSHSFLLGRGWQQRIRGSPLKGHNCMERLASVANSESLPEGQLEDRVKNAIDWLRRLRGQGSNWQVLPKPSVPELWPNMSNEEDFPWHKAKGEIADSLRELTKLWWVGPEGRVTAHQQGVESWDDPQASAQILGVSGSSRQNVVQRILDVNRSDDNKPVRPAMINTLRSEWHQIPPLEFYVDFETVDNQADEFANIPDMGGQPLIFMIGCGHVENEQWVFRCFIADSLTESAERMIIDEWYEHMRFVKERLCPHEFEPRLIHWFRHEPGVLESNDESAFNRQRGHNWTPLPWFDFLLQVVEIEPIVVRGAFKTGLKDFARAMRSLGLVETGWKEGPADGTGAMAGAWWCAGEAAKDGVKLQDIELMQDIAKYNEVDCKVMLEIVRYLRENH